MKGRIDAGGITSSNPVFDRIRGQITARLKQSCLGKVLLGIVRFVELILETNASQNAAAVAYYLVLSIFPLAVLLLTAFSLVSQHLVLDTEFFAQFPIPIPEVVVSLIRSITAEAARINSVTAISLSSIATLWLASRSLSTALFSVGEVFRDIRKPTRVPLRFAGTMLTLAFVIGLVLSLIVITFGNQVLQAIFLWLKFKPLPDALTNLLRYLIILTLLWLLFQLIFYAAMRQMRLSLTIWPGSLTAAIGWVIISGIYSIYIDHIANLSSVYGSLASIVILMIWFFICSILIIFGAVVIRIHAERLIPPTKN